MYLYMSAGVCRDQKRVSSTLEVELWAVMSCPMWVLKLSTQHVPSPFTQFSSWLY